MMDTDVFDEVHYWTEVKLDIVREYASAYSTILAAQARPRLYHVYVDAFAGAGMHVSKRTGEFIPGSPLNALAVEPPFREVWIGPSSAGSPVRVLVRWRKSGC